MSMERRPSSGSAPHVTKRLCATLVFFIGIVCIFGGYLLGRMARHEVKKNNDLLFISLSTAADNLYKKAKLVSPKAVHHNGRDKITAKLLDAFQCDAPHCGVAHCSVADFVKNLIHIEVSKLNRSIHNSSLYLDSLR